jgi:hypothetical protein
MRKWERGEGGGVGVHARQLPTFVKTQLKIHHILRITFIRTITDLYMHGSQMHYTGYQETHHKEEQKYMFCRVIFPQKMVLVM